MSEWVRVEFKGETIWAESTSSGDLRVSGGLVAICYREGGKVYKTREDRLKVISTAPTSFAGGSGAGPSKKRPASTSLAGLKGSEVVIQLWTDGACSGNPGPAGAGVLLRHKDIEREIYEYLGHGTNNIAELTAILLGLKAVEAPETPVQVITDSSYSIGLLTKGWKPKANQALVASLREEMRRFKDLTFVKVKGHAGVEGNERADELARRAIEERP
jgi:ribonuclease HI